MASDARITAAAINAAISSADYRNAAAPEERRWKGYWTKYWCFKSQKRERQVVPATRADGATESVGEALPAQSGLGLVPPSSPASFVNSSMQSPARSLAAVSASMYSPGPINTMFTIGPYAHETQLVSPPVFSTFTTEPSTAPFTPPPELAHLTTPLSPDVPFAQYIASSLKAKAVARETISPLSTSTLPSPCDTPASYTPTSSLVYLRTGVRENMSPLSTSNLTSPCDTPASYRRTAGHIYLGSPVGHLVFPTFGYVAKDTMMEKDLSPSSRYAPSFPTFDPFAPSFNHVPALMLPCDSKFEDPQVSVESKDKDEGSSSFNESRNLTFTAELKLEHTHSEKEAKSSILTEQHDSSRHSSNNGAEYLSNATFPTSHMQNASSEETSNCEHERSSSFNEASNLDFTPELKPVRTHLQKEAMGSMLTEQHNSSSHGSKNGAAYLNNAKIATLFMENVVSENSSNNYEQNETCISSIIRDCETWDSQAISEKVKILKTAEFSEEMEAAGGNGVTCDLNATCLTLNIEEYDNHIHEGERLHIRSSRRAEGNEGCISTTRGHEHWEVCHKCATQTTHTSKKLDNAVSNGIVYQCIPSLNMEEYVHCSHESEKSHRDLSCQDEKNGNHGSPTIGDHEGWQCGKNENNRSLQIWSNEEWQEHDA